MIRRESRIDYPHIETETRHHAGPGTVHDWGRPILVGAFIVILMLGAIGGVNGLIALFP